MCCHRSLRLCYVCKAERRRSIRFLPENIKAIYDYMENAFISCLIWGFQLLFCVLCVNVSKYIYLWRQCPFARWEFETDPPSEEGLYCSAELLLPHSGTSHLMQQTGPKCRKSIKGSSKDRRDLRWRTAAWHELTMCTVWL